MPAGASLLDTTNTLAHPTGSEYQLVLGEGTYTLKDDLHLATPPPHPSDVPQPNNNPLATTIGPPTAGLKLSIVVLASRKLPARLSFRDARSSSIVPPSIQEEGPNSMKDAESMANGAGLAFGEGNPALTAPPTKARKELKLKPKNSIVKSNSSYVSRVVPHDTLPKRLSERSADGLFAFANVNRSFVWLDLSSNSKTENLTKVLFTKAHALCHDVNAHTQSSSHLDVILGTNTGDIIWYEPMSQKYARLNKNGAINSSPVSTIRWLPDKENLFLAAHADGTLVVYDKDKEDSDFTPEDSHSPDKSSPHGFRIQKSVQSRNQKLNPIAVWNVSNAPINGAAFSPDGRLLAVVSDDGLLTILDYIHERVRDVFRSYYGAMLCLTWSPDGRYVLTGGQDDLVSIWSLADRALVARCIGHHSWVTDVKFDPWRCDERTYRFGSVGEDCQLLLWDFSVGMLGRPKATPARARGSASGNAAPHDRNPSVTTTGRFRSTSSLTQLDSGTDVGEVTHSVEAKANVALLPPVMSKDVDPHPLCWLGFEEHCIITSCKEGESLSRFYYPFGKRTPASGHVTGLCSTTCSLTFIPTQDTFVNGIDQPMDPFLSLRHCRPRRRI